MPMPAVRHAGVPRLSATPRTSLPWNWLPLVVVKPSMLNIRNLILIVGVLLVVVFAVITRGWLIERNVRRQITTMAEIERQRSRILEDINGSRPLSEILEGIAAMVSSTLAGAPCWCEI